MYESLWQHSLYQVGAKMGKSTRPVYWGHTVITGRTVVGDMLQWAPRMCSATSS